MSEKRGRGPRRPQFRPGSIEEEIYNKTYPDLKAPTRIERPNNEEYAKKSGKIDEEIKDVIRKIQKLESKIKEKSKVSAELRGKTQVFYDNKKKLNSDLKAKKGVKEKMQADLKQLEDNEKSLHEEISKMKKKLPHFKKEEFEIEIHNLETELETGTMSMNEERKILNKIRNLKQAMPGVDSYSELMGKASKLREEKNVLRNELKEVRNSMNEVFEQIQKEKEKIDEVQSEKGETVNREEVEEQIQKLRQEIDEKKDRKKKLKEELDSKWKEHKDSLEEMKKFNDELNKRRKAELDKHYQAQREERKKKEKELRKINPHGEDIKLCDALISYLKALIPKEEAAVSEKKSESATGEEDEKLAGLMRMEDPRKSKGKKKGRKGASDTLTHTIDKFEAFAQIGVTPPLKLAQLNDTIDLIEKKKSEFLAWTPPPDSDEEEEEEDEQKQTEEGNEEQNEVTNEEHNSIKVAVSAEGEQIGVSVSSEE